MNIKNLSALLVLAASPIALSASPETDRKIENAAMTSFNLHTVLEDRVQATARNGVVTLTGSAQDKFERDLAVDTAASLQDVRRVDSQIKVGPRFPEQSDAWISTKIRNRLQMKTNVNASKLSVAVWDGNVILTGTADSWEQKNLTQVHAWNIAGVKTVQNDLVISESLATEATTGNQIDDASITAQVKYALLSHKSASTLKTNVTTKDGVVNVTGNANSAADKSRVTELASDVHGAKSVDNNLAVKG